MLTLERVMLSVITGFCGILALQAAGIKTPAQTFPLFVTIFTGSMAAFALASSIRRPLVVTSIPPERRKTVLVGITGLVAYVIAMSVSYVAATVVFLFLGYIFLSPERTPRSVTTAFCTTLATTGFTWLCFSYWLGVNLH